MVHKFENLPICKQCADIYNAECLQAEETVRAIIKEKEFVVNPIIADTAPTECPHLWKNCNKEEL